MAFKSLLISSLLVGLFIFSMTSFAFNIQQENAINNSLASNPEINLIYANLNSNLSSTSSDVDAQKQNFEKEVAIISFDNLLFTSIRGAGKAFTSTISNIFNTFGFLVTSVFGLDPIFLSVLGSILSITVIFSLWRVYRTGE